MRPTVIVSGALANKPHSGGEAWVRLSWATGLQRLGYDVYFVEQIDPAQCVDADGRQVLPRDSVNCSYFDSTIRTFGFQHRSSLVVASALPGHEQPFACAGLPYDQLKRVASEAQLLVNISGHLAVPQLMERIRRKAYVDIDPGFTQFWHADPNTKYDVSGHDHFFTIGENIGSPACPIPTGEIAWQPIRQPVVLKDWPVTPVARPGRFTTVASWRGAFGPVVVDGRRYGTKVHEFRKVFELPSKVDRVATGNKAEFELALSIHPADAADRAALLRHGWAIVEPHSVASDAESFRRYVQGSAAEFSVAQGIYVETASGWFSDRTIRYLASGRPTLVQQTGFDRHLPVGEGLLSFTNISEAADGVAAMLSDYPRHARAARELAVNYFDSDRILTKFLSQAGVELPDGRFSNR